MAAVKLQDFSVETEIILIGIVLILYYNYLLSKTGIKTALLQNYIVFSLFFNTQLKYLLLYYLDDDVIKVETLLEYINPSEC